MTDAVAPAASPDFERYARESIHVEARFPFPAACAEAMRAGRGIFVDLGAGDGAVLQAALEQGLLAGFDELVALDVSRLRVERIAARALPRVRACVASAQRLPVADASVDFVFSHQVIEHVDDDAAMAREILRSLKPGGAAFVTSVSKRWYGWYFYRCNGKFRLDPTHLREYASVAELAAVFARAGFAIASTYDRPLGHALDKIALRVLLRLRLVSQERARRTFRDHPILRFLGKFQVRVPGYRYAEILVRKPATSA